jgi:DNA-3-methyladenine glycosylase II
VPLVVDGERVGAFPLPAALLAVDAFASLPAEKIARLHAVARAAQEGLLDVEHLRPLGERDAIAALRTIRGIGAFWASGIYLRACGIVDAWPEEPISNAALGCSTAWAITRPTRTFGG